MATSIQVREATLEALRRVKEELNAPSYDDLVQRLLVTHRKRRDALVAIAPGLGPFHREPGDRD